MGSVPRPATLPPLSSSPTPEDAGGQGVAGGQGGQIPLGAPRAQARAFQQGRELGTAGPKRGRKLRPVFPSASALQPRPLASPSRTLSSWSLWTQPGGRARKRPGEDEGGSSRVKSKGIKTGYGAEVRE